MKSLLKITENIVEKNLSRLGSIQNHIFFNWAHIAGQYADITIPHKIKFGRKKNIDGQITIKVQNGFGLEVQYAIPLLLDQINARFGFKAISKIKIIQADIQKNFEIKKEPTKHALENTLENLESNILPDSELKLAMQEFEISRKK
jgi:hypothetical protein